MIEVIPVMLFILGWHPDHPGEIDLQRPEVVYLSLAQCEEAGGAMAVTLTEAARDTSGMLYQHRCMPVPSSEEFDRAFERRSQR